MILTPIIIYSKNCSLLAKFLNGEKLRIRCKFAKLTAKAVQTQRDLLGSFYLIFILKFGM
ncbi:PIN family toxin-antitoxin system [Fusobacterium pseudoperiodonticum]|nr:PIN family toxin-antitoxin system [Fusobacterium pseudoperiodonticum]